MNLIMQAVSVQTAASEYMQESKFARLGVYYITHVRTHLHVYLNDILCFSVSCSDASFIPRCKVLFT